MNLGDKVRKIFWAQTFGLDQISFIRKDCFQNKSKFITDNQFTKHVNITIH